MTYSGNQRLGDLFTSRREKGRAGLPTLSVTLNDGLVDRDDLNRKQDTSLSASEHLLVKPDDIAYNMMRMWQGAFGRATKEGLVSPAYVVLKKRQGVDSSYAEHLFKTPRMTYLFWAYSYGLTEDRLRLYFQDFAKIPVAVPSGVIQERIGKFLNTWERAVQTAEKLKKVDSEFQAGLTAILVRGRRRLKEHHGTWKRVPLKSVASVIASSVDKKFYSGEPIVAICNYVHVYHNRFLDATLNYDKGSASKSEIERFQLKLGDIVITKDSEEASDIGVAACVIEEMEDLICGYHLAIIRPDRTKVDPTYLSALFSLHGTRKHFATQANGVTRFGLQIKTIEDLELSLPPLEEQQEIAKVILSGERISRSIVRNLAHLTYEQRALSQFFFKDVHSTARTSLSTKNVAEE